MDIAGAYAEMAGMFRDENAGPFWPAYILSQDKMKFDEGGSLVPGMTGPWKRDCTARVDTASTTMRGEQGFAESDRQIVIPAASLSGPITTDHQVQIRSGPYAGVWHIESLSGSSAASQWIVRGRKA